MNCVVCGGSSRLLTTVDDVEYFNCSVCDLIFADPKLLADIDAGLKTVEYDNSYWELELPAARQRSFGVALARVAEIILYNRRPIENFLDIGSGPGFLLDALAMQLPSKTCFHAAELFPPPEKYRTQHPNYHIGSLTSLPMKFDGGTCIEVIEHMTPTILHRMLQDLSFISNPGACYMFNSGLSHYTRNEDMGYLDPNVRGHIISWSIEAFDSIARNYGFRTIPITGKSYAFVLEYQSDTPEGEDVRLRIWSGPPENRMLLDDALTGNLMYVLGLDTARAI